MKTTKAFILILTTTAACLTACSGNKEIKHIAFGTVKAERTVAITGEQGAPQCIVSLQLACADESREDCAKAINAVVASQLLGMDGLTLQEAADSFAASYTRDYQRNFAPLYREDHGDETKRAWYEYHYNITSEATEGRDGVVIYTAAIDYYEGGAHGINQYVTMNFDNQSGRLLRLADVFVPGDTDALNERLLEALMEQKGTKTVDELRNRGYLYSMDMFASENFELGDDAITFIYNPYEIAPYTEGMTRLTLKYNDLKDILKKE